MTTILTTENARCLCGGRCCHSNVYHCSRTV